MDMKPLKSDEKFSSLIEEHGELELNRHDNPFQRLIESIVNQQLSTESAKAIKERLFDRFEVSPEAILEAEKEELSNIGLSRQKINYIQSTAETFIEDDLSPEKFSEMHDEEVIEELTQIHGIGDWTAKMFLIFVLGREDVFPVGDLGIQRAMEELYGEMEREEMVEKAEDWRPYRTYASLHLWKLVD